MEKCHKFFRGSQLSPPAGFRNHSKFVLVAQGINNDNDSKNKQIPPKIASKSPSKLPYLYNARI